jgi:hypothetical protein
MGKPFKSLQYHGVPLAIPKRLEEQLCELAHKLCASQPPIKHFSPVWRKPIRKISSKKAKSDRLYNAIVKEWLAEGGGRFDVVAVKLGQPAARATCNHHIRGRHRTLKFDKRYFCPTTIEYSLWPHQNIKAARKLGLIAETGDWHRELGDAETERIKAWMIEKGIY